MKLFIITVLVFVVIVLGIQVRQFLARKADVGREYAKVKEKLEKAEAGRAQIESELRYFSNPENAEKEIRGRFNLRSPGEKLIIIVPKAGSPPSSTSP